MQLNCIAFISAKKKKQQFNSTKYFIHNFSVHIPTKDNDADLYAFEEILSKQPKCKLNDTNIIKMSL